MGGEGRGLRGCGENEMVCGGVRCWCGGGVEDRLGLWVVVDGLALRLGGGEGRDGWFRSWRGLGRR